MSGAPLSARDLRDWLDDSEAVLAAARVTAVHGAGPRLVAEGSSWISFSSNVGSGRLVRAADGSSRSSAHRYSDGATILDTHGPTTTDEQLHDLARALTA